MDISIIGAGAIAQSHLKSIQHIKGLHLRSVYDIDHKKMEEINLKFNGKYTTDLEEIIDSSNAVIIASPNHLHAMQSLKILNKKKHVLCEKPMSSSLSEANIMVYLSEKTKAVASLGFNYRYLPIIKEIKKLLREEFFGEIIRVSLGFKKNSAHTKKRYTWRDSQESLATSGAIGDLGSHLFDLITYLLNSPYDYSSFNIKAQTNVPYKENKRVFVDDHCYVCGRLKNGAYFDVLASKSVLPEETGFDIHLIGANNELYYTSRNPDIYYIKSSYFWAEKNLHYKQCFPDPNGEIRGWADTFYHQLIDWKNKIEEREEDNQVASFMDGLSTQRVLTYVLKKIHLERVFGDPFHVKEKRC